jgi:DNA-binding NtrC family response regulator
VDEFPEDLRFYSTILEAYGYGVRRCSSYREGVRCLAEEAFDFVIVSQGTANFEGTWVLMRATEVNPSLPVLVVARYLDMDSYLKAMQLGAMDYLVEPLTVWEVGRLLENPPWIESLRNGSEIASRQAALEG